MNIRVHAEDSDWLDASCPRSPSLARLEACLGRSGRSRKSAAFASRRLPRSPTRRLARKGLDQALDLRNVDAPAAALGVVLHLCSEEGPLFVGPSGLRFEPVAACSHEA
jgi:hypothetical protein